MTDSNQTVTNITTDLITHLGFKPTVSISSVDNTVNIECDGHAILIGKKGENLRALQYILNTIYKKQDPTIEFYSIDIAGYKKARIEKIHTIAHEAAKDVAISGREVILPKMNAYERRQVHMVLADDPEVVTESYGQEPNRTVVVKKR